MRILMRRQLRWVHLFLHLFERDFLPKTYQFVGCLKIPSRIFLQDIIEQMRVL